MTITLNMSRPSCEMRVSTPRGTVVRPLHRVQATVATADQLCWVIAALEMVATRIEDLWPSQERLPRGRLWSRTSPRGRSSINVSGLRGHVSCARRALWSSLRPRLILLHARPCGIFGRRSFFRVRSLTQWRLAGGRWTRRAAPWLARRVDVQTTGHCALTRDDVWPFSSRNLTSNVRGENVRLG
jgi:hypothetical protein